jgi:hypothetical protein
MDLNTPLSSMNESYRQKINIRVKLYTIDQINIEIYRLFPPTNAEYTFSSIDYMLHHKTSLNKFKKIELIACIFPD